MTLEDFRAVADEKLSGLEVTPERAAKIARACRKQGRTVGWGVWTAAAACFVVMAVAAGVMMRSLQEDTSGNGMIVQAQQATNGVVQVAGSTGQTVQDITLDHDEAAALPDPVTIGEYSEGLAPAMIVEELWGYVNQDGVWQVAPIYLEAGPVREGQAIVVLQSGSQQRLFFP